MKRSEPQLIKISTAAKLIGVTRQAIYKHIHAGNLGCIEIDGAKFVNRDELLILDAKYKEQRERRRSLKEQEG